MQLGQPTEDANPVMTGTKSCVASYNLISFKLMMTFQGIKNVDDA